MFDVKHDGTHWARLAADGNLAEIPLESVCSGVVAMRGMLMVAFLAELNDLLSEYITSVSGFSLLKVLHWKKWICL